MYRYSHILHTLSVMALILSAGSNLARCEEINYARDIRPILSDRCYTCHGPDGEHRATDMRLDQQDSAHEWAIVPGDPTNSELVRRITSQDPDGVMPPPDANLALTSGEIDLLQRWIAQGAVYAQHWSFAPLQRPRVPTRQQSAWPRNEIDFFVLDMLEQHELRPSVQATPEDLLRRVTVDLTGLPPTPVEIDQFLSDCQTDFDVAYERLVDRLLASHRFGERLAVDWLDVARYADTYGYQNDRHRDTWPWRDWVIDAFNGNLPYDEFIRWQIAGDLLPSPSREQILATAFNRHHRQTNEGGSSEEEFRSEYVADRVNTFGAAFLGLTLECCRCHDHKYDPLTQREYYQLAGFFDQIDESGLYSHFTEATPTPTLLLATEQDQVKLTGIEIEIADAQRQLDQWRSQRHDFDAWRSSLNNVRQRLSPALQSATPTPQPEQSLADLIRQALKSAQLASLSLEDVDNGRIDNMANSAEPATLLDTPSLVSGKIGNAIEFSGDDGISIPAGGDFTRNQPFTIACWIKIPQALERAVVFHRSRAWTDSGSRGYELLIEEGKLSAALVHFWPGNALRVRSVAPVDLNRWVHVAVCYDGSSTAAGLHLFVDGELTEIEVVRDALTKNIRGADGAADGDVKTLVFGQRFRDRGFKGGQVDEIQVFNQALSELEVRYLYLRDAQPDNLSEVVHNVSDAELLAFYHRQHPDLQAQLTALKELRTQRSLVGDAIPEIMVMRTTPVPRATFLLNRGAYDSPGEQVQPGLPASLSLSPLGECDDRLDLAEWLLAPDHPLTARVAVNRFWQSLFGRGLVQTAEDFGLQGAPPSHPQLLDWLSLDWIRSGWDVKRLLKTIVLSATYRQASNTRPELSDRDPENVLLARGPAVRLSAEMIRDAALNASGLLVNRLGGPPVKPYQPDGLWEEKSGIAYRRDAGAGSHRRSLYTYWKRTSPPPSMMTFDASNREVCVVRRQVTMTPLQTLVLLNDPQYVEAARAIAELALRDSPAGDRPSVEEQLQTIFVRLTSRRATPSELEVLQQMRHDQLDWFESQEGSSTLEEWLAVGDHQVSTTCDRLELAALSAVASALMAYDETVMKR